MSEIKKTGIIVVLFIFAACSKVNIPQAYNFKISEVQNNPFGCWTDVEVRSSGFESVFNTISGELIAIDNDTLYLLIENGKVERFYKNTLISAQLYTHKNQSGTYSLITGILITPNILGIIFVPDAAVAFFVMALPAFITGAVHAGIEGKSNSKSVLRYPGSSNLEDLKKFARFPAGLPENIDLQQLYLK